MTRHDPITRGNGHHPADPHHDHTTHDKGRGNDGRVNPCLLPGTWIAAPGGRQRLIEDLTVGDRVSVLGGGSAEIVHISRNSYTADEVAARPELRPWRFDPEGLVFNSVDVGAGVLVSQWHRVAMSHWSEEYQEGVLIAAIDLAKCRPDLCRRTQWSGPITWLNLYTEEHAVISADGIPVETGWLGGEMAPRLLGDDWPAFAHLAEGHRARPALPFVRSLAGMIDQRTNRREPAAA